MSGSKGIENSTIKNYDKFISELIEYYELSMGDISKSIGKLAQIQDDYPKEYEEFLKISQRPDFLLEIKISDQIKNILFELLLKSSTLTQKLNKLLDLTSSEKKALAEELEKYVKELKKKFEDIRKNDE